MKDVAVVIPSRNRSILLLRAVASALAQDGVDVEVIVVLDATDDDSAERLAELKDSRIHLLEHGVRRGDAAARNTGLAAAEASWIAFLDDDDIWAPHKLRVAIDAAADRGFAYAGAVIVDDAWRIIETTPAPDSDTLLQTLLQYNAMPAGASNVVARREALADVGEFDAALSNLSDWDLWIRLAATTKGAAVAGITVACTCHAGNRSLADLRRIEQDFRIIRGRYKDLADANGVDIDRVSFDRWTASVRRRAGRRGTAAALYLRSAIRNADAGSGLRAVNALVMPSRVTRPRLEPSFPEWLSYWVADDPRT